MSDDFIDPYKPDGNEVSALPLKIFAVVRKSDGFVLQRVTCVSASEITVDSDHEVQEMTEEVTSGQIRFDSTQRKYVPLPPMPSSYHQWQGNQWVDLATAEQKWSEIRKIRDAMLAASDWIALSSLERGKPLSNAVKDYRQSLRDMTTQADPFNVVWPAAPAELRSAIGQPPVTRI
jgi:hypothetical protein